MKKIIYLCVLECLTWLAFTSGVLAAFTSSTYDISDGQKNSAPGKEISAPAPSVESPDVSVKKISESDNEEDFIPLDLDVLTKNFYEWIQSKLPPNQAEPIIADWKAALEKRDELSDAQLLEIFVMNVIRADSRLRFLENPEVVDFQEWLIKPEKSESMPDQIRSQVCLYYMLSLARMEMYEEAMQVLSQLRAPDVMDPAGLLFHRAVIHHKLLEREECVKTLEQLEKLPHEKENLAEKQNAKIVPGIPKRYVVLVDLMLRDMEALNDKSLEHIARRMADIRRRLNLGHAGQKVQTVEKSVLESLDEMIKQLEDEQNQSNKQCSQCPGNGEGKCPNKNCPSHQNQEKNQSANPAQDSRIMGGNGPGNVDRKSIGSKSGWGNLPESKREESIQQVGRDFPPHYRAAIEQYFRRQASEEN